MTMNDRPLGKNLSTERVRVIRSHLLRWGKENFKDFPWRRTTRLWHGLIAEVLLQRTRAGTVVDTYNKFIRRYERPSDLAEAPMNEIKKLLYPLGLPERAKYLKKLGQALAALDATPPDSIEKLRELPGIGPYAAAAYVSFHLQKKATIIDANVVRWICRLVGKEYDGETRRKRWFISLAERLTPSRNTRIYNYAVLDFTLEICTTHPKCEVCPIGPRYCIHGRRLLKRQSQTQTTKRKGESS